MVSANVTNTIDFFSITNILALVAATNHEAASTTYFGEVGQNSINPFTANGVNEELTTNTFKWLRWINDSDSTIQIRLGRSLRNVIVIPPNSVDEVTWATHKINYRYFTVYSSAAVAAGKLILTGGRY